MTIQLGDVWIPQWLKAVGSQAEIDEWVAITRSDQRPDLYDHRMEFQHQMRRKHPDMPLTFEEQIEQEYQIWMRLQDEYQKARTETLKVATSERPNRLSKTCNLQPART